MSEKLKMAKAILKAAADAGADEADIRIGGGAELEITVRMGELDVLEQADSGSVTLRVFRGRRQARISATNLGGLDPARFAEEAVSLTAFGEPDEVNRLPEPELYAAEFPELDLVDDAAEVATDAGIAIAREAEAAALAVDERIDNSQGGFFSREAGEGLYIASNGFERIRRYTHFSTAAVPVATDAAGQLLTSVWSASARHFADLPAASGIGRVAGERARRMIDSRPAPTGEFPVVFEGASVAPRLARMVFNLAGGPAIRQRMSCLIDRVGTRIASDLFTLVDDPHRPRGLGSRACDGEGLPCARREIVTAGTLNLTPTDVENARRLAIPVTGHGTWGGGVSPGNLHVANGAADVGEIIASVDRGLLITRTLGGGNFNSSSGHWSQACEGLWIERGEIAYPVSKVTFAGTLEEILTGIEMVGDDLDFSRGSVVSPTLKIRSLTLAGS